VFTINIIFWVDSTINIGIIVSNNFNSYISDLVTRPSIWAFNNDKWTITISHTVIWTVVSSPIIFTFNNTFVEFTFVNNSITVDITVFNNDSDVFGIDVITIVDLSIIIGIVIINDFFRDIFDGFTIPMSWALDTFFEWSGTVEGINFWTEFSSPYVFGFN
jgi:hypothetical protein